MTEKTITVVRDLLATNKQAAAAIRQELRARGILCVNLLSSPGSGKTTLLEALADRFRGRCRMAVIEGDIETERDAERIRRQGRPGLADHDRRRLPSRGPHGRQGPRRSARGDRSPVHRERRQPRLPRVLRPRRGSPFRAALVARGGRQAGEVPAGLPLRRRPDPDASRTSCRCCRSIRPGRRRRPWPSSPASRSSPFPRSAAMASTSWPIISWPPWRA